MTSMTRNPVGKNGIQIRKKSKSLVINRGKVDNKYQFSINKVMIPSLGNIFDHSLKDNEVITKLKKDLELWLKKNR